jgi:hypothetical protein
MASLFFDPFTRRRPDPDLVRRPIAAGDVTDGMRVVMVGTDPMTIIPGGARTSGAMVTLVGMDDAGDLVSAVCPAEWLLSQILDPPALDLSCSCGEDGCAGTWPVLERDPRPGGRLTVLGPGAEAITFGQVLGAAFGGVSRPCDDDGCSSGPEAGEPDQSPGAAGGYL